mmetsp:Transcript_109879/g.309912  ORF Transcript_109879/g.309912 Transcript_109879/m.309912 type:complete len:221 (-) Transcript_109879:756-1418(-)
MSTSAAARCPAAIEQTNGESPFVSFAVAAAPRSSNSCKTATCPSAAAQCNAVLPVLCTMALRSASASSKVATASVWPAVAASINAVCPTELAASALARARRRDLRVTKCCSSAACLSNLTCVFSLSTAGSASAAISSSAMEKWRRPTACCRGDRSKKSTLVCFFASRCTFGSAVPARSSRTVSSSPRITAIASIELAHISSKPRTTEIFVLVFFQTLCGL